MTAAPRPAARRPLRFAAGGREMTGFYHPPRSAANGLAALLCNPFGQEAIRAHRVFAVLAERLARRGVAVLRFDYYATGDSLGADEEGELEGWTGDVLAAHAQLEQLAQPRRTAWVGLRLGALLAARAAGRAATPPATLVAWEPVVDGPAYLAQLVRADRAAHLGGFSLDARRYALIERAPLPPEPEEALGFALAPTLRAQLRASAGADYGAARCERFVGIAASAEAVARLGQLRAAAGGELLVHQVKTRIAWASNDSGGTTIAPAEVVGLIVPAVLGDAQ